MSTRKSPTTDSATPFNAAGRSLAGSRPTAKGSIPFSPLCHHHESQAATNTGMFFLSSAYMTFRPLSASKGAYRLPLGASQHFGNQFTDDERINFLRSSSRGHVRLQDSIALRGYTPCVFITTLCIIERMCMYILNMYMYMYNIIIEYVYVYVQYNYNRTVLKHSALNVTVLNCT